ncbi:MAG TPA: hypothetical protein VHO46_06795 [Bacteroidales bacterium]|nr:hypothetical protein [Bacteroidales bacterium]
MKRLFFICLSLLLFIPAYCQETNNEQERVEILFQGKVMDSKTLEPLPGAQLFINRNFFSASDDKGGFSVYVHVSDTVLFTHLGYKPEKIGISDTLARKPYAAGVFLTSDTLDIGEVVIVPRLYNLRSELFSTRRDISPEIENARNNVAISAYQGRTTTGTLNDPASNYEMLRHKQKIDAFERGGIPSDRILGLSPFMIVPAAYMLMKGLPEKPAPYRQEISDSELDEIVRKYLEKRTNTQTTEPPAP